MCSLIYFLSILHIWGLCCTSWNAEVLFWLVIKCFLCCCGRKGSPVTLGLEVALPPPCREGPSCSWQDWLCTDLALPHAPVAFKVNTLILKQWSFLVEKRGKRWCDPKSHQVGSEVGPAEGWLLSLVLPVWCFLQPPGCFCFAWFNQGRVGRRKV